MRLSRVPCRFPVSATSLLVLFALGACTPEEKKSAADCDVSTEPQPDNDGDDYPDLSKCEGLSEAIYAHAHDCGDNNINVHPGAAELCDGLDNDCDGSVDEDAIDMKIWYTDGDGDGFGDDASGVPACGAEGRVDVGGDCDDSLATGARYYPGADETDCTDPEDYNCDGSTGYDNKDGDEFAACQECDDNNAAVNPDAEEACDGVDNNCDGGVDEGLLTTYYRDGDGDGFGVETDTQDACDVPVGYSATSGDTDDADSTVYPGSSAVDGDGDTFSVDEGDCDDANPAISPDADEVCDGVDNNCDGNDDEGVLTTYYGDSDGDGFGDAAVTRDACEMPEGYSATNDDPDDTDAAIFPGSTAYDDDGDGYSEEEGDTNDADFSVNPENDNDGDGFRLLDGDCHDGDANVYPAAWEQCNGVDDDCDGAVDEDVIEFIYRDGDGDGFGDASGAVLACVVTVGTVIDNTDCDDAESTINPAASELCNGVDDDCDGLADDADTDAKPDASLWYYPDRDGDGYVDSSDPDFTYTKACDAPSGYVSQTGDCDRDNQLVYPLADEVCDGARNDCTISSAYWTANAEMLEAGLVSYIAESGDLITDYSGLLPTTPGSPTTVTLTANGSLNFCADPAGTTWYVNIEADNLSVDIAGLRGSSLTELSGDGVGRPIAVTSSTADVSGLTLSDGYATGGGGLYAQYTSLTLSDVVLLNNDATGVNQNDAALTLDLSQATLTDVLISGSVSGYGLGCYVSRVSATGLTVEANDHTGMFLYGCTSSFADVEVSDNIENGLYITSYGTTTITDSFIHHNMRGIYAGHAGTVSIENSSINNNGHVTGAGIYALSSGDFTLTDTKVESNHGDAGGAVYLNYGVNLSMTGTSDCAIQNNVDAYANAAYFPASWTGTLTSSGCVWAGGQDIYYASTATTEVTSTFADPLNFTCTSSGCL